MVNSEINYYAVIENDVLGEYLHDSVDRLFSMRHRKLNRKEMMDILDFIKSKNYYSSKDTIKRMKMQTTE